MIFFYSTGEYHVGGKKQEVISTCLLYLYLSLYVVYGGAVFCSLGEKTQSLICIRLTLLLRGISMLQEKKVL